MPEVLFSVQRVEMPAQHPGPVGCLPGTVEVIYTIKDKVSGEISVRSLCQTPDTSTPCEMLSDLDGVGYTPNDWHDDCTG